jgi:hypothetical protein
LNNLEKNYYQAPQAGTADHEYLARLLGAECRERSRDKNYPQNSGLAGNAPTLALE